MQKVKREKIIIYILCLFLALIIAFGVGIIISKSNRKVPASHTTQASTEAESNTTSDSSSTTSDILTTSEETTLLTTEATQNGTIDNPVVITIDDATWYLTLVNSSYRIPDSYRQGNCRRSSFRS